jgi:DNA-3-methyladenine glycosylase
MKLVRRFYERDTLTVARELIGKKLVHETEEGIVSGRIVETEAYIGPDDKAAHSCNGRRTERTGVMYWPGGYAYVYLIYGMYCCFNIVTNVAEKPEAVLIRALEPEKGVELMMKRRNSKNLYSLCSGPGKLCIAMGISRAENKVDLCGDKLYLLDGGLKPGEEIITTPRKNIDYAGEAKDYPWRFIIRGNKYVSR